jgi:predicted molibdopterin-dependent oxidoreductase YjgC
LIGQENRSEEDKENNRQKRNAYLNIRIDKKQIAVPAGVSVAAALIANGIKSFRKTDQGDGRGLFCGMGVCYDCLVTIDGIPDQLACMVMVGEGMQIRTGKAER